MVECENPEWTHFIGNVFRAKGLYIDLVGNCIETDCIVLGNQFFKIHYTHAVKIYPDQHEKSDEDFQSIVDGLKSSQNDKVEV